MHASVPPGPRPCCGHGPRPLAWLVALALVGCGGDGGGLAGLSPADDGAAGAGAPAPGVPAPSAPASAAPARTSVGTGDGYLLVTVENELVRVAVDGSAFEVIATTEDIDFRGVPDVLDGRIHVGAQDNTINAFDLASGEFLWESFIGVGRFDAYDVTAATCVPGGCLIGGDNGMVMAVDPASGSPLWSVTLRPDGDVESFLSLSTPVVVGDRAYVATGDGGTVGYVPPRLYALGLYSGEVLGSAALDGAGGTPVIADDGTLLVSAGGVLSAFDPDTLGTRWRAPVGRASDPGTDGNVVVVHADGAVGGDVQSFIAAFDLATGAELWEVDGGSDQSLYVPIVDGGVVYAARDDACSLPNCRSGYPVALDAATGAALWEDRAVARVRGAPTLVGDLLVYPQINPLAAVSATDSGMGAIDARDGSVRWVRRELSFLVGGSVFVSPEGLVRPPWAPTAR